MNKSYMGWKPTLADIQKWKVKKKGRTPNVIVTWSKTMWYYYYYFALWWGYTGNAPKLGTTGMFLLLKTFRILAATALFRS